MALQSVIKNTALNIRKLIGLFTHLDREVVAAAYLSGNGIELGALHNPLRVPSSAKVKYLDRMSEAELRKQYPELAAQPLVTVDIVDDGQTLYTIADESQDFVIANHFLEHCENPIQAIHNMLRVLKANGTIFLALPDKRFTFDGPRDETGFDHLLRDFRESPAWSRRMHFEEWVRRVEHAEDRNIIERVDELMREDYSIHFHVWTQDGMLSFLLNLKRELGMQFEVELFLKGKGEAIFVLRKQSSP